MRTPAAFLALLALSPPAAPAPPVRVLSTTTDLRALAAELGGDRVDAESLLKGPEDPHFVDARPEFIRLANRADLFLRNGMELEIAYEPLIVAESRNPRIQPGSPGHVDCSAGVRRIEVPEGAVDRSQGDVHPTGNPHYLADPMNARIAARTIRDALKRVDPPGAAAYDARCDAFTRRIDEALFGPALLERYPAEDLAALLAGGTLLDFLERRKAREALGGWAASLAPFAGAPLIDFHQGALRYLAARFHLEVLAALEPKPGIAPSPRHLAGVLRLAGSRRVKAIIHFPYNPRKPVERVTEETGAAAVLLAHQVDARPGTGHYIAMMAHNVMALAEALSRP